MAKKIAIPTYSQLIEATYSALKQLGGSGKNIEINDKVSELMKLSDESKKKTKKDYFQHYLHLFYHSRLSHNIKDCVLPK